MTQPSTFRIRLTVYFDGAGNNKDHAKPKGRHTNVARLCDCDTAKGTNLAFDSPDGQKEFDPRCYAPGESAKVYLDGAGGGGQALAGAFGFGSGERINRAYLAVVQFSNANAEAARNAGIDFNIVGFGRGAALARALANAILTYGIPATDEFGEPTGEYLQRPHADKVGLHHPDQAQINFLGLFDTVASFDPDHGLHHGMDLRVGPGILSCIHCVALHEYGNTLPLTTALNGDSARQGIKEFPYFGAHAQIGGGYPNDVLAAGPLALMYHYMKLSGIELRPFEREATDRIIRYDALQKQLSGTDPEAKKAAASEVRRLLIDWRISRGEGTQTGLGTTRGGTVSQPDDSTSRRAAWRAQFEAQALERLDSQKDARRGIVAERDNSLAEGQMSAEHAASIATNLEFAQTLAGISIPGSPT